MNPSQLALLKYLEDSLPYFGLLALGYFVLLAVMAQRGVKAHWKGNAEVALLTAFFHALTNSDYYRYLSLPRLPLPATTLSAFEVFAVTAVGLFVTLAVTNLVACMLAALLGFNGKQVVRSSTKEPVVSMAAVTKKRRVQDDEELDAEY